MHDGAMSIGVEERTRDEICDDRSGKVTMNANEDPPDLSALFAAIQQAHVAIRPHVPVTPLALSVALSGRLDSTVLLKNEHLQPTALSNIVAPRTVSDRYPMNSGNVA